mmetsp:Transcript_7183/g.15456  ORF Transcript_7183/g.15456 Transcript_7183/m.15456 type:complete len:249 (-) Transcript_7183:410-1156(-)
MGMCTFLRGIMQTSSVLSYTPNVMRIKMRRAAKKENLSENQMNLLREIGFTFDVRGTGGYNTRKSVDDRKTSPDELWDAMFGKLFQFHQLNNSFCSQCHPQFFSLDSFVLLSHLLCLCQDNGHTNIPDIYPEDPTLAGWIKSQRVKYHFGKLPDECIDQLDEIGFDFDSRQGVSSEPTEVTGETIQLQDREAYLKNLWDSNYEQLKQNVKEHGHCKIPINYEANPSLGAWSFSQKLVHKKKKLSGDRV